MKSSRILIITGCLMLAVGEIAQWEVMNRQQIEINRLKRGPVVTHVNASGRDYVAHLKSGGELIVKNGSSVELPRGELVRIEFKDSK